MCRSVRTEYHISEWQVRKRWSTVRSTPRMGWSTSRTESAAPKIAARFHISEWQVQKPRSTVPSTPWMGWSTSKVESAEPKVVERGRRLEWQVRKPRSSANSTHRTGWSTSGVKRQNRKLRQGSTFRSGRHKNGGVLCVARPGWDGRRQEQKVQN